MSSFNVALCPADDAVCHAHSRPILSQFDRSGKPGISRLDGEARQSIGFSHVLGNANARRREQREEPSQVVDIGERCTLMDEDRFDRLLRRLLSVEAVVLQIAAGESCFRAHETAPRPVEPFGGVIGRKRGRGLTRHTQPYPPAALGRSPGKDHHDSAQLPPASQRPRLRRPLRRATSDKSTR